MSVEIAEGQDTRRRNAKTNHTAVAVNVRIIERIVLNARVLGDSSKRGGETQSRIQAEHTIQKKIDRGKALSD